MKPKTETQKRSAEQRIIKEVGKVKTSYNLDDTAYYQVFVKSHLFTMTESKIKKIKEIQNKYARLDAFDIYSKEVEKIVHDVLTKYDYPEEETEAYKVSQDEINKRVSEKERSMEWLRERQFEAKMFHSLVLQMHLEKELIDNPHRFKVTIEYNPEG